jgi:hypothetical protein
VCVMCDVVEEGEGEHNGKKREVVIRRITCCSLRTDATNGSSDAGDSAGVFMTISMDYSSRHLDQCDGIASLQRASTDLDRAGLVIGFDISIKASISSAKSLACCKKTVLSGLRPVRYAAGIAISQQR